MPALGGLTRLFAAEDQRRQRRDFEEEMRRRNPEMEGDQFWMNGQPWEPGTPLGTHAGRAPGGMGGIQGFTVSRPSPIADTRMNYGGPGYGGGVGVTHPASSGDGIGGGLKNIGRTIGGAAGDVAGAVSKGVGAVGRWVADNPEVAVQGVGTVFDYLGGRQADARRREALELERERLAEQQRARAAAEADARARREQDRLGILAQLLSASR